MRGNGQWDMVEGLRFRGYLRRASPEVRNCGQTWWHVERLGFRVCVSRFRVWSLGFRVQGLGFGVQGLGFGFGV